MKLVTRLLPFLVIAMFVAIPSYAQNGAVSGNVKDREGKPAVGLTVQVDRVDIQGIKYGAKTDKDGDFYYAVPPGDYRLSLMEDGKALMVLNKHISPGPPTEGLDFDMKKAPAVGSKEANNIAAADEAMRKKIEEENKAGVSSRDLFNKARTAFTAKNYEEAASLFQQAAEKDPKSDVIVANLAQTLGNLKKYDEAAGAYEKAISLADPKKPEVTIPYYINMSLAYGNAGKFDQMGATAKKVAELSPVDGGKAYFNLGVLQSNSGHTKEADEAFKKTIELDPKYALAYYQIAIPLFGDVSTMKDAVPYLNKYLELAPTGENAEAAKALIQEVTKEAPTGFRNEEAIAKAKADAEKAEKDKAKNKAKNK